MILSECSPIGRGNGLKIRPVWVRVPPLVFGDSMKRTIKKTVSVLFKAYITWSIIADVILLCAILYLILK